MKIEKPLLALWIYFGIGLILYKYGITGGSLLIFDLLVGIVLYKMFVRY